MKLFLNCSSHFTLSYEIDSLLGFCFQVTVDLAEVLEILDFDQAGLSPSSIQDRGSMTLRDTTNNDDIMLKIILSSGNDEKINNHRIERNLPLKKCFK